MNPLAQSAPDVIDAIKRASPVDQRRIAAALVCSAIDAVQLDDSRVERGLETLRRERYGESAARVNLAELVRELDEIQWNLQDTLDGLGRGDNEAAYDVALKRARVAEALYAALGDNVRDDVPWVAYQVDAVLQDTDRLRELVMRATST